MRAEVQHSSTQRPAVESAFSSAAPPDRRNPGHLKPDGHLLVGGPCLDPLRCRQPDPLPAGPLLRGQPNAPGRRVPLAKRVLPQPSAEPLTSVVDEVEYPGITV